MVLTAPYEKPLSWGWGSRERGVRNTAHLTSEEMPGQASRRVKLSYHQRCAGVMRRLETNPILTQQVSREPGAREASFWTKDALHLLLPACCFHQGSWGQNSLHPVPQMSICNTCDVELMRSPLEYQNEMFLKRRPALSVESRVKAQTEVFMPMVSGAS